MSASLILILLLGPFAAVFPSLTSAQTSQPQRDVSLDWPQLGHDPQRTNATQLEVSPPYCYAWKWYEVPIASRAQPVVAGGRLFIGSMDGSLYARDASTGAPLWSFATRGPIRHSAAVIEDQVFTSSHDGYTYALDASTGSLNWQVYTGPSSTAPLADPASSRIYIANNDGGVFALQAADGMPLWQLDTGAPMLISPALSQDGSIIFTGNENIEALAVDARTGRLIARQPLQGQSLADRYPVVAGDQVVYRTQPIGFFHNLLHEGDDVMDSAGTRKANPAADWDAVSPKITSFLEEHPDRQTFFAFRFQDNQFSSTGTAPVLYTYGNNDTPAAPVWDGSSLYLPYRARRGIQTDGGSVHVTSNYDAELGRMDPTDLTITGLTSRTPFNLQFRLTSDEDGSLTLGGDILLVDNWERLGAIDLESNELIHIGNVSNDWPECYAQCGEAGPNPFFPLSGRSGDPAYPFPDPRVTEGRQRPGAVVANNMIYWRAAEAGLAGISHSSGGSCPSPQVWQVATASGSVSTTSTSANLPARALDTYLNPELASAGLNPPPDLVRRLRSAVSSLLSTANGDHLLPYYVERGFSQPYAWPAAVKAGEPGPPDISHSGNGTLYWYDPGELIYTLAMAYPYLDAGLKAKVKSYVAAEMERYPPLEPLPWEDSQGDWLRTGSPRERYSLTDRASLSNWPPPAVPRFTLYALWLWSKNTGDWSYVEEHWTDIQALYESFGDIQYYADIAGYIGYAQLTEQLGTSQQAQSARSDALEALKIGQDFSHFLQTAVNAYPDPRGELTGWQAPVFFGLTPEIGAFLADQTGGAASEYLHTSESGNGLRWWYLTRAGVHAEVGESSFLPPTPAWSHFLAHAYVERDSQEQLRLWLDRAWTPGDLYDIQKIAAVLAAPSSGPGSTPRLQLSSPNRQCQARLQVTWTSPVSSDQARISIFLPEEVAYINESFQADAGSVHETSSLVVWSGEIKKGEPRVLTLMLHSIENTAVPLKLSLILDDGTTIVPIQVAAPGLNPWFNDRCPNP